jgi:hypothetical protein
VWRAFGKAPNDRIQIAVTDDGRGMTYADRAKPAGKIEVNLLYRGEDTCNPRLGAVGSK